MKEAKKMGHSLYGILRRREYVDDITKVMFEKEEEWSDKDEARDKFSILAIRQDYSNLCNQAMLNDEKLVSFGSDGKCEPLMAAMGNVGWKNGLKLFHGVLNHHDRLTKQNGKFVKEYMKHESLQQARKILKL